MQISNYKNIFLLAFLLTICSCSVNDYTIDESNELKIEDLMSTAIRQVAFNQTAILGRSTAVLIQHLEETDNNSSPILTNYNMSSTYLDLFWTEGLYGGSLKNATDLLNLSQTENSIKGEAVARILLALELGQATATFGDIPYTEALLGEQGLLTPKYDPQEMIYNDIINHLETAIILINEDTSANLIGGDLLANGDMNRWEKLAYGLLARYSIQLSKRDPNNYSKVIPLIEKSFNSIEDQLEFNFSNSVGIENPFYSYDVQRPFTFTGNTTFIDKLENNNDPRRNYYFNLNGTFGNLFWSSETVNIPILSYCELMFMKAETLLMTGATDDEISEALKAGIQASFDQMDPNIPGEDYISRKGNLDGLGDPVEKMERIITEAYTSYYGFGWIQAWNNYRRLNFPVLARTGSVNPLNPKGVLPRRFLYPESATEFNAENVEEAVNRQGGALLDQHIWAFDF